MLISGRNAVRHPRPSLRQGAAGRGLSPMLRTAQSGWRQGVAFRRPRRQSLTKACRGTTKAGQVRSIAALRAATSALYSNSANAGPTSGTPALLPIKGTALQYLAGFMPASVQQPFPRLSALPPTVGLRRATVPGLTNSVAEATKPRARRFSSADVKLKRDARRMVDACNVRRIGCRQSQLVCRDRCLDAKRVGPARAGTRRGAGAHGTIAA